MPLCLRFNRLSFFSVASTSFLRFSIRASIFLLRFLSMASYRRLSSLLMRLVGHRVVMLKNTRVRVSVHTWGWGNIIISCSLINTMMPAKRKTKGRRYLYHEPDLRKYLRLVSIHGTSRVDACSRNAFHQEPCLHKCLRLVSAHGIDRVDACLRKSGLGTQLLVPFHPIAIVDACSRKWGF